MTTTTTASAAVSSVASPAASSVPFRGGCRPRMAGCRRDCGHRQLVHAYRAAREAAELDWEAACAGYAAEEADYGPLPTFKSWLTACAGSPTQTDHEHDPIDTMEDHAA